MEVTKQNETCVVCDGPCHVCKHNIREKDVMASGKDILFYCRNCQKKYLCKDVLGRFKGEYTCPVCGSTVTEMTIERAHQLGLSFCFTLSRTSKDKRPIEEIKKTWFYSIGEVILKKQFVTDLIELEELGVVQLIDLLYHADFEYRPTEEILDKKSILWEIFSRKPAIIRSIHNSLVTKSENRRVDLILRALVNNKTFNCSFLSTIISTHIAGTVDLIGIDEDEGKITWIIVQEDKIDERIVNNILNEILSLPPLEFMGVSRILLLTKKWIWMGAEIARKQGRIQTRWTQIDLELWEEDPLFRYKKL
ncbi:MAG: hypothetical protein ACTSPG_05495 [Candidatus Hodarchaeales archaeon]